MAEAIPAAASAVGHSGGGSPAPVGLRRCAGWLVAARHVVAAATATMWRLPAGRLRCAIQVPTLRYLAPAAVIVQRVRRRRARRRRCAAVPAACGLDWQQAVPAAPLVAVRSPEAVCGPHRRRCPHCGGTPFGTPSKHSVEALPPGLVASRRSALSQMLRYVCC